MNYSGLRAIIKNIKTSVACPGCDSRFGNDDLAVVSAVDDRCIIVAQCPSCNSAVLITASLQQKKDGDADSAGTHHMHIHAMDEEATISSDDVVSIHELLKDFKGDLAALVGRLSGSE